MTILVEFCGLDRVHETIKGKSVSRINGPVRRALRELMAQTFHRELHVRRAEIGILFAGVELYRPILIRASHRSPGADVSDVEFPRLPRFEALRDLFWKALGIGCGAKCFLRQK